MSALVVAAEVVSGEVVQDGPSVCSCKRWLLPHGSLAGSGVECPVCEARWVTVDRPAGQYTYAAWVPA